jgi:hypothetical protein
MRTRKALPIALTAVALTSASVASAATNSYRDGPLTATFSASTTRPNCKQKWPVTVTAKFNGKPTHASAFYQFLFNGTVVGKQYPFSATSLNRHDHVWNFYKSFYDYTFGPFGALSVGKRLNVRAVVKDGRYTAYPGLFVSVVNTRGCPAK